MARTVHVIISGRVQGVGYRAWVEDQAVERGLSGWVRNRSDTSVEAVFSGPAVAVEAMISACRTGPRLAMVRDVAVADAMTDPPPRGFRILSTA
jgi:acylphosphatase